MLSKVQLDFQSLEDEIKVSIQALYKLAGQTGVEIEARTTVHIAVLILFDMCKVENTRDTWPLDSVSIIHRVGQLNVSEKIVFLGGISRHQLSAYQAKELFMGYLKNQASFFKKKRPQR